MLASMGLFHVRQAGQCLDHSSDFKERIAVKLVQARAFSVLSGLGLADRSVLKKFREEAHFKSQFIPLDKDIARKFVRQRLLCSHCLACCGRGRWPWGPAQGAPFCERESGAAAAAPECIILWIDIEIPC